MEASDNLTIDMHDIIDIIQDSISVQGEVIIRPDSIILEVPGFMFTCNEDLSGELSNYKRYEIHYSNLVKELTQAITDLNEALAISTK